MQILVQVGDVLDRGEDEIAILSLLEWLGKQARSEGGGCLSGFIQLLCSWQSPLVFRFTTLH